MKRLFVHRWFGVAKRDWDWMLKFSLRLRLALAVALLIGGAPGGTNSAKGSPGAGSATFSLSHHGLTGGGGRSRGTRFVVDAALNYFGAAHQSSSAGQAFRVGFAGQLNDPPRPGFDVIELPVGESLAVTTADLLSNDTDLEDDPFTLTLPALTTARGGALRLEAGSVFYTAPPGPNLSPTDAFAYQLTDATGLFAEGRVFIVLTEPLRQVVELRKTADTLEMTFLGLPRAVYKLQFRPTFDTANPWRDFPEGDPLTQQAGGDGTYRFVAPVAGAQGFFRAVRVGEPSNLLELARTGSTLTLSFLGAAGARYQLQFRARLDPANPWTDYPDGANPWIEEASEAGVYQFRPTLIGREGYFRAIPIAP